ncbi:MAG: metalloregulator ArsR/SmtB family transcription factor [Candidatus Anstonellales archaeon]
MKVLKAVADINRLKIMKRLAKGEECACRLLSHLKVSQPACSQHLKVLLEAGLVKVREEGSRRIYSLSKKGLNVLKDIARW